MDTKEILEKHANWLKGERGEEKCNLSGSDLSYSNLSGSDLSYSDLSGSDLSYSNLSGSDLSRSDLSGSDLSRSDLSGSDLSYSDLSGSDLSYSNLSYSDLSGSDLSRSDLSGSNLSGSDLSGSQGIQTAKIYLARFGKDKKGIIVYKAIGNTYQSPPEYWDIKPNSFLEEVVNPIRTIDCGCGVNFATLDWIKKNFENTTIWKCRILWEDLADVVVPYNTDGKARCARLQLIEPLKEE
jgi:uncharacterized protein YjbI with pentapeptide repeats